MATCSKMYCLSIRNTYQIYALQYRWRWFPSAVRSLDIGYWVQEHPKSCHLTNQVQFVEYQFVEKTLQTGPHFSTHWILQTGFLKKVPYPSHTSWLPISQGITVTPCGRLASVRYSPRGSSI